MRKKNKKKKYEASDENSGESELSPELDSSAEDLNESGEDELEKS